MESERVIRNERFSGADWALEEVDRVRYEDCAFHDVDWSEARLTGAVLTGADLRGANLDGVALREVAIAGAKIDLAQAVLFATAHGAQVSG